MKQDKRPVNDKGQPHGYWEYFHDNNLLFKGSYINSIKVGYWEWYNYDDGVLIEKTFYIL